MHKRFLEKKLRGIVLNFLRADALSKGTLPDVKDGILAMLAESKRTRLKPLSADELMEMLDWLELSNIVSKKWGIFEKKFGDKTKFMNNSQIVNQRPDAHAKDFDQADFALYRRALSQIEEGVVKLG